MLCNIVLYSIGLYFNHQSHLQLGVGFALAVSLQFISPLFSSSIVGTYLPEEFIFQCHIFLPFHTVYGVLKARMEKAMATHSSTHAWKIPWVEEPGRLQSMGLLRVRPD